MMVYTVADRTRNAADMRDDSDSLMRFAYNRMARDFSETWVGAFDSDGEPAEGMLYFMKFLATPVISPSIFLYHAAMGPLMYKEPVSGRNVNRFSS